MSIGLLDRYLWRHLRGLFLFGVGLFTLFLMVNHLFFLARLVLQEGATFLVALELLSYRLPYFLAYSFPMAMLLASLMAISRLSDGQEITAMRTAGISLRRIAASVAVAGALVTLGTWVINETVVPPVEDRYELVYARVAGRPQLTIDRVLFRDEQGGVESIYFVRHLAAGDGVMEGVSVTQYEEGKLRRVIDAASARYLDGRWQFRNGTMYLFTGATIVESQFAQMEVGLRRTPGELVIPQKPTTDMSVRELLAYIRLLERNRENVTRYYVELHSKVAIPTSALLFALLAVPLGLRPHRSGPSVGLGLTILVLLGYYILYSISMTLGQGGRLPPIIAAWLPNVILAAAALLLVRRVDR